MLNLSSCLSANIITRGDCITSPDAFILTLAIGIAALAFFAYLTSSRF
jgi:hypothetical protein